MVPDFSSKLFEAEENLCKVLPRDGGVREEKHAELLLGLDDNLPLGAC